MIMSCVQRIIEITGYLTCNEFWHATGSSWPAHRAGKTTVARRVATVLNIAHIETDALFHGPGLDHLGEEGLDGVVQDWLVAFHGEDVLPVAGQDLFDVAPVDVECVGGDHDPREVTRGFTAWWCACDLVEQGDHLSLFPRVLGDFPLAEYDSLSVGERGEQPDLACPGVHLLPGALECLAIQCQSSPVLRGHEPTLQFREKTDPDDCVRLISNDVFNGPPDRGLARSHPTNGNRDEPRA
jgi:hypothetical protein